MKSYDINQRWGKHIVRVTFQCEDYKATGIAEMGGNVKGASLLQTILDSFEDEDFEPNMKHEENEKHIVVDEDGYVKRILMYNETGDTLWMDEAFGDWLVGVEIIDFVPEAR